jgi:hypothetical protein
MAQQGYCTMTNCIRFIVTVICFAGILQAHSLPLPTENVNIISSHHHNIRIGTFIHEKTPQWVLDAIRTNVRNYNALPISEHSCVVTNTFYVGHTQNNKFPASDFELTNYIEGGNHTGDIFQEYFKDNINGGKTLKWFHAALSRYHKADFIIKADTDTAVHYASLCNALKGITPSNNVYMGECNLCIYYVCNVGNIETKT